MTVGGRRVKGVEGSCEVNRLIGRYGPVIQKKGRRDKGESGEEGVGGSEEVEGTASLLALLVPMDWVRVVW